MRKIVSGMQISLDGYIEDRENLQDWVENWEEDYGMPARADTCVLGGVAYVGGYEDYWSAVNDSPDKELELTGSKPTSREKVYAKWASRTPHIVVSQSPIDVKWENTRVIDNLNEIRQLKKESGKDIYVVGGAKIVASLINENLIDEIHLLVHPILLGGGKTLFADVVDRHHLRLESAKVESSGKVRLIYSLFHE